MAENKDQKIVSRSGGFLQDLANRARLIGRLVMDSRVNPFLKILPVGALLYVVFPDLLPLNPVDDAFVLWLGTSLFVELCPHEVVQQHLQALQSAAPEGWQRTTPPGANEEVVDGEYQEQDGRHTRRSTSP